METLPAPVKKVPGRPFVKGQVANPTGRTKKTNEEVNIKELAKQFAPEAFAKLVFWANSNSGKIAVQACNSILDRAYGKPTQQIDHGNANDKPLRFTISLGRD